MKIAVINTGGTISCVGDPLTPMSAEDFARASQNFLTPLLSQSFPDTQITFLTDISFPESASHTLDSTNLQPRDWCIMGQGILKHYANFDGFVVLHGTDSMDFSGAALSFLLNAFNAEGYVTAGLSKPVVITGSQLPMYYQNKGSKALSLNFNTDAYQNVCGAIGCARVGIPEVCVYFQNRLYRGSRVLKTNASMFHAFSSPNFPVLAEYGVGLMLHSQNWQPGPPALNVSLDSDPILRMQQAAVDSIMDIIDRFPVVQLNAFPARYTEAPASALLADLIHNTVSTGARGIILESYGEGNFPSGAPDSPAQGAIYQAILAAHNSGLSIVDCTQVIAGTVNNAAYASGAWLPRTGVISPADMSPMASFAKLMILMAYGELLGWSRYQIERLFQSNLAGEMISVDLMDSRINPALCAGQSLSALDGSATLINHPNSGPTLYGASQATPLWTIPIKASTKDLPGRLVIQNDGNLVFYSRSNQALWSAGTGSNYGTWSKLRLSGSCQSSNSAEGQIALEVIDYVRQRISGVIYKH